VILCVPQAVSFDRAVAISSPFLEITVFVSHHKVFDSIPTEPSAYVIFVSHHQVFSVQTTSFPDPNIVIFMR